MSGVSVLFLAGGPIQPPLQRGMGFPVAGLPLDSSRTLLAAWLDAVDLCVGERQSSTLLLCSSSADSEWFSAELRRAGRGSGSVEVRLDARPHRGVCGLIADTAAASPLAEWLLLVELNTLPPLSLSPLLQAVATDQVAMVVGVSRDDRPSGVYLLKANLLKDVPRVGYVDLKEQFLPQLVSRGCRIESAVLAETSVRLTDRRNYLRGIRIWQSERETVKAGPSVSGNSLLCEGVVAPEGSFVLDSAILPGAMIGRGAVIARSVVGPLMHVPDGAVLVDAVLANPRLGAGPREFRTSQGIPLPETPSDALPSWSR